MSRPMSPAADPAAYGVQVFDPTNVVHLCPACKHPVAEPPAAPYRRNVRRGTIGLVHRVGCPTLNRSKHNEPLDTIPSGSRCCTFCLADHQE